MNKFLLTTEYKLSFNPSYIVQTEVKEWSDGSEKRYNEKSKKNLSDNRTKGVLSPQSIKKIKKAIDWLVFSSKKKKVYSFKDNRRFDFKVNFITLTIPPQEYGLVKEKDFKSLINTWLVYHRKYSNLNNYVWKIEAHKDNRLHIHIVTDTFIHLKKVRDSWNLICKRGGLLEFHFKKFNDYNPPSTDIKSVKKIKNVAAYMSKYMAKEGKAIDGFGGRVWACSSKLSNVLKNGLYISPDKMGQVVKPLIQSMVRTISVETKPNTFGNTFKIAEIYLLKVADWWKFKGSQVFDYMAELIKYLRTPSNGGIQTELTYNL